MLYPALSACDLNQVMVCPCPSSGHQRLHAHSSSTLKADATSTRSDTTGNQTGHDAMELQDSSDRLTRFTAMGNNTKCRKHKLNVI